MIGFFTSSIQSYKIIMLIRWFQTTAVTNQGATSCWEADAMGANTWPNTTSHLTHSTCHTKTLEIEFEVDCCIIGFKSQMNTMYRLSCQFLAPLSGGFITFIS